MQRMELFINLKVGRDIWIDVTEKKKKRWASTLMFPLFRFDMSQHWKS